jgi:hypothetical protein
MARRYRAYIIEDLFRYPSRSLFAKDYLDEEMHVRSKTGRSVVKWRSIRDALRNSASRNSRMEMLEEQRKIAKKSSEARGSALNENEKGGGEGSVVPKGDIGRNKAAMFL